MTASQRIALKMSAAREKLNELIGTEDRSDTQNADMQALTGELQGMEPEYRAALTAEGVVTVTHTDSVDAETRERLELRSRANLGGFLLAAL